MSQPDTKLITFEFSHSYFDSAGKLLNPQLHKQTQSEHPTKLVVLHS